MDQTVSIHIKGKVQGVYFRQSTLQQAVALGITGTVRNTPDGCVRVIATGPPEKLETLLAWCKKGPGRAVVSNVEVTQLSPQTFADFRIER